MFLTGAGWTKVLDFGLAQVLGAEVIAGGTPRYMPPEQRRHEPPDARADVFSAAVVLHEALTGTLPPEGGSPHPGAPEASSIPGAPRSLAALVARALSPEPRERPRDGAAWLEALLAAQREVE